MIRKWNVDKKISSFITLRTSFLNVINNNLQKHNGIVARRLLTAKDLSAIEINNPNTNSTHIQQQLKKKSCGFENLFFFLKPPQSKKNISISVLYLPRRAPKRLLWKIPITLWMAVLSCCSSGCFSLVQYSSKSPRALVVSTVRGGKGIYTRCLCREQWSCFCASHPCPLRAHLVYLFLNILYILI